MKPTKYRVVEKKGRACSIYLAQKKVWGIWVNLGYEYPYYYASSSLEEAIAAITRHKNKEHLPRVIWEDK